MAQLEELLRKASFKPPKVGAPDNRQGGATRLVRVPDKKLG